MKTSLIALLVVACAVPAFAQKTTAPGTISGHGGGASAPSTSKLPRSSAVGTSVSTAPFAWVDDASLLPAGAAAVSAATASWIGTNATETDAPVVGVAAGVAPWLQLSAHVPFVVGDATSNVGGGVGTSYISGKIGLVRSDGDGFKLSVAPTVELFGTSVVLSSTDNRARFGLPVSAEFDRGSARAFASAGYFAGGVGFIGGGAGYTVNSRVSLTASLSRSWTSDSTTAAGSGSDRTELAGGATITVGSHLALFGSIGQTIGTTDANGAGTTIVAGVLVTSIGLRP